ncbi:MAG TPA: alpha/beta family hydrolase [Thermoanaerobaculia bacterium]|nr:alpha/beta family hydrolase [Thermoanaerobaculia bacterium]
MERFLFDGPARAPRTLVLAHGAGAPMDSPFLDAIAKGIASAGFRVARFEFPYMRARREEGKKRPPDRGPALSESWREAIRALSGAEGPRGLVIGGKSLGGRIASLVADEAGVGGLVCLGYPFHPPGKPDVLRVRHLESLKTPGLIVQGARDPFGGRGEVPRYRLSPSLNVTFLEDGDHSFRPRASSGRTEAQNLAQAVALVTAFLGEPSRGFPRSA